MKKILVWIVLCLLPSMVSAAPNVQSVATTDGLTAWLIEDHNLPIVALEFSWRGGTALDPTGKTGTVAMLAALLTEGSGPDDANQFSEKLQTLAASIDFSADSDYLRGQLRCLRDTCDQAWALLHQAITQPRFDAKAIARVRAQMIAAIKSANSDPDTIAAQLWQRAYFGTHSYGQIADAATISAITRTDLLQLQQQIFTRANLRIGIAGAVSPTDVAQAVDGVFGTLPLGQDFVPSADITPPKTGKFITQNRDNAQMIAVFGQIGPKRNDPDFYALTVANHILGGGGFSSRLTTEIREKRGLTYGIGSYLYPRPLGGVIQGSVATRPEKFAEALTTLQQQWRDFPATITQGEVDRAKDYLLGSFPLRFSSTPRLAEILLSMQEENLGIDFLERRNDFIRALDHATITQAAQRWINADALTIAIIGPNANQFSNPTVIHAD